MTNSPKVRQLHLSTVPTKLNCSEKVTFCVLPSFFLHFFVDFVAHTEVYGPGVVFNRNQSGQILDLKEHRIKCKCFASFLKAAKPHRLRQQTKIRWESVLFGWQKDKKNRRKSRGVCNIDSVDEQCMFWGENALLAFSSVCSVIDFHYEL